MLSKRDGSYLHTMRHSTSTNSSELVLLSTEVSKTASGDPAKANRQVHTRREQGRPRPRSPYPHLFQQISCRRVNIARVWVRVHPRPQRAVGLPDFLRNRPLPQHPRTRVGIELLHHLLDFCYGTSLPSSSSSSFPSSCFLARRGSTDVLRQQPRVHKEVIAYLRFGRVRSGGGWTGGRVVSSGRGGRSEGNKSGGTRSKITRGKARAGAGMIRSV